jgi:hypothetical protein
LERSMEGYRTPSPETPNRVAYASPNLE